MLAPDLSAYFTAPPPVAMAELSIPERIAAVIREAGGDGTPDDTVRIMRTAFLKHPVTGSLTEAELEANMAAAMQLVRNAPDPLAAWDTDIMLNRMVAIACAALPTEGEIFRAVRDAGYSNASIAAFWPRLMSRTADAVRTARLPEVA